MAFVACGHSLGVKGDADGGTEAGILDAIVEHVSGLLDGTTKDAHVDAGEGGGAKASCTAPTASAPADSLPGYLTGVVTNDPNYYAVHGGRYFIPAGQMLCAFNPFGSNTGGSGELQWAGFVPYQ